MRNVIRVLMAVAAVVAGAACTVQHTSVPPASGPSELALSLRMTATPDTIPQDGASQSAVVVQAFDAAGQPKAGVSLRMSVTGLGSVTPSTVVTGSDGKATAAFVAPMPGASTTSAIVVAAPAGSDASTATPFQVSIRLTQVGAIAPVPTVPNSAAPTVEFVFSPNSPVVGQSIFFNASQTIAAVGHYITLFNWDFGDGVTDSTTGQFPSHQYQIAGTYNVLLTVTDDVGAKSTRVHAVTIGQGLPTVVLVVSKNGLTVTADAGGSFAAPGSAIVNYVFIWNDGSANDTTASSIKTHLYPGPVAPATTVSFTVTVRAIDDRGRVGTAAQSITLP